MLHKYQITIVMPDGSRGTAWGLFASQWAAIDSYLTAFANARRISARRLK
jgi:hypothetical protein